MKLLGSIFGRYLIRSGTGGASRSRTDDLLRARQALYQLSYGPVLFQRMVGLGGLEPPTSPLSGVRSNHLSYKPGLAARKEIHLITYLYFSHLFTEKNKQTHNFKDF